MDYDERITSDPEIMHGQPVVKGTRVPVAAVLGCLAAGEQVEDVVAHYPQITREDVLACLALAAALTGYEVHAV